MAEIGMSAASRGGLSMIQSMGTEISAMVEDIARYTLDGSSSNRGNTSGLSPQAGMEYRAQDIVARAHSQLGGVGSSVSYIA